jgi:hypothetical protein
LRGRELSLGEALAFTVMTNPVPSVAYAIEAGLTDLDGVLCESTGASCRRVDGGKPATVKFKVIREG